MLLIFQKGKNIEVHLVLIGKKREIIYEIPNTVIIHRPNFVFNNNRRTIDAIRTVYFVRSQINKIHPNTILSFGEIWNNLTLMSLYGCNFPIYICDRSQPNKDLGKLHNFLRNALYPHSSGYIAQTDKAGKVCLSKGWNNNVQIIGNPIRTIQTNGRIEKENIILTVGRLIKTKHFDQLIRMFVEINNSDWELVIVGGDAKNMKLSEKLETLIKDLKAEKSIFLEGEQKNIDQYYKKSKIFAFTSSSEGFPNVIGEALSAGLPVVSYDCNSGPSEMIDDGENGYLVPVFNKDIFKERLKKLMNNETKRKELKKNTKQSIRKYKAARIADRFYSFITGYEDHH